jgi:hypothetical protein
VKSISRPCVGSWRGPLFLGIGGCRHQNAENPEENCAHRVHGCSLIASPAVAGIPSYGTYAAAALIWIKATTTVRPHHRTPPDRVPQRFAHRRSRRHVTPSTTRQKPESPDSWLPTGPLPARPKPIIRPACHRSAVPCPAGLNACCNRGHGRRSVATDWNCATRNSQGTSATTSSQHPPHTGNGPGSRGPNLSLVRLYQIGAAHQGVLGQL